MPIIHADYIGSPSAAASVLQAARTALKESRTQAIELLKAVRSRAAKSARHVRRLAQERGYAEGQAKARADVDAQKLELNLLYANLVTQAEADCVGLVLKVAREVIGSEISARPETLAKRIETQLSALLESRGLKAWANPAECDRIKSELSLCMPGVSINVQSSSEIKPGQAILESLGGRIELDWLAHFEAVSERLLSRYQGKDSSKSGTQYATASQS